MRFEQLDITSLPAINHVISEATAAWPLPERFKRLATPALHYMSSDFDGFEFVGACKDHELLAVAAWGESGLHLGPAGQRGALLHGLYVAAAHQRGGIGCALLEHVAMLARRNSAPGLLVKAQRVSVAFFKKAGLSAMPLAAYPHSFWLALQTHQFGDRAHSA
ncbi:MAG: GNAT family N-acetyltransferase [Gammaproteobacteria bacterium]|nr:GNAT family N-acetyltransferase [Gammaproteobacteria bacterium]